MQTDTTSKQAVLENAKGIELLNQQQQENQRLITSHPNAQQQQTNQILRANEFDNTIQNNQISSNIRQDNLKDPDNNDNEYNPNTNNQKQFSMKNIIQEKKETILNLSLLKEMQNLQSNFQVLKENNLILLDKMCQKDQQIGQLTHVLTQHNQFLEQLKAFFTVQNFDCDKYISNIQQQLIKSRESNETKFSFEINHEKVTAIYDAQELYGKLEKSFNQRLVEIQNQMTDFGRQQIDIEKKIDIIQQSGQALGKKQIIQGDLIDEKVSKNDFDNIKTQLRLLNESVKVNLQQLADKDLVTQMQQRLDYIEKYQKSLLDKVSYYRENDKQLSQIRNEIIDYVKLNFTYQSEFMKKLQDINETITGNQQEYQLFKRNIEPSLETITKRIDNLWQKQTSKLDTAVFNEFKQYAELYVHKKDIDDLYLNIIPAVNNMKDQTKRCIEHVEKFRKLLLQMDEAILFRATRTDIIQLEKKIENEYICLAKYDEYTQSQNEYIKSYFLEIQVENKKMIEEYSCKFVDNNLSTIVSDFLNSLHFEVFIKDVEMLKKLIKVKADRSEIIHILEMKTNRVTTDQQEKNLLKFNDQLGLVVYNLLEFMNAFDPENTLESDNTKKKNLKHAMSQIMLLQEHIDKSKLNFQQCLKDVSSNEDSNIHQFLQLNSQNAKKNFEIKKISNTAQQYFQPDLSLDKFKISTANQSFYKGFQGQRRTNTTAGRLRRKKYKNSPSQQSIQNCTTTSLNQYYNTLQTEISKKELNSSDDQVPAQKLLNNKSFANN